MSGHRPSVILGSILKPIACGSMVKVSVQTDHVVPRYVLFLFSLRVENDTTNEISDDTFLYIYTTCLICTLTCLNDTRIYHKIFHLINDV